MKIVGSRVENLQLNSYIEKLMKWLIPPDPSTNFNKALRERHQDSGQWFLRSPEYTGWKKERKSSIWLNGIPGCGKTILSTTVIEDLKTSEVCREKLLYFYFDFTDTQKQSFENLIRSLLYQLYQQCENSRNRLDSLYSTYTKDKQQPSTDSLCTTFQSMLQQAGEFWIVLDALDECKLRKEYLSQGLLPWIESLRDAESDVHLLITSRPEHDIKESVDKWLEKENIIPLQSDLISDDIGSYIRASVRESDELSRWRQRKDLQSKIEDTLIEKANGM